MTSKPRMGDPAQSDLAWMGYHPRALVPVIVLAVIVSLIVWTGRWFLEDLSDFSDRVGTFAVFALGWAVWPALVVLFLYRTVTYAYRLTNRSLLVDFGFLARPTPPIDLVEVSSVVSGSNWLARRFGTGWLEVHTKDRVVRLSGVRRPEIFAVTIRDAVERAKAGQ